jgi:hypothetical protein
MKKTVKRELYAFGARLTVVFHFLMLLFYFASIPLLFAKNIWSMIAAAYLIFEWLQYLVFDSCVLNHLENHFLKKLDTDHYQQAIFRFFHNLVRGKSSQKVSKSWIDKLSWYFKTVWFATAVVVLALASPIRHIILSVKLPVF